MLPATVSASYLEFCRTFTVVINERAKKEREPKSINSTSPFSHGVFSTIKALPLLSVLFVQCVCSHLFHPLENETRNQSKGILSKKTSLVVYQFLLETTGGVSDMALFSSLQVIVF